MTGGGIIDGDGRLLHDSEEALALLGPHFDGLAWEELRVVHLDGRFRALGISARRGATATTVAVPIRDIVRDALQLGARAILLAHNHPSGDPTPSHADKGVTRRLVDTVRPLDIRVLDHLIFAGGAVRSLRHMGLL